jgi:adenosylhomocysteine nucleosidase
MSSLAAIPLPLLITFAVKEEARPLQRHLADLPHIYTLITGMGRQNAERATRHAIGRVQPRLLITAGFAGGLNPALPHGSLLFEADTAFPLTNRLLAGGVRLGRFHCTDRVAITASEKRMLRKATGADALEMESGAIRALCHEHGIAAATVRVISDTADEDLPLDFNTLVTPAGRPRPFPFALALLRQPGKVAELIRFQKRIHDAAEQLAGALMKCCRPED